MKKTNFIEERFDDTMWEIQYKGDWKSMADVNRNSPSGKTRCTEGQNAGASLKKVIKDHNLGIRLLPDVKRFDIELTDMDFVFKFYGIDKREGPAKIKGTPFVNREINRYVVNQFLRLERLKKYPKRFWVIAWRIMNSRSFLAMALHHVMPGWYTKYDYETVLRTLRHTRKLIKTRSTNLKYSRVYITKGETYRPLGVPTPSWRLYLHMYTKILFIFLKDHIPASQHGFQPGKGVITAWKDIMENQEGYNIYEFDLKKFFDTVSTAAISTRLKEDTDMPTGELYFIQDLLKSLPDFGDQEKLLDESATEKKEDINKAARNEGTMEWALNNWKNFAEDGNQEISEMLLAEFTARELGITEESAHRVIKSPMRNNIIFKFIEEQWAILSSFKPASTEHFSEYTEGVPQGAPCSPLLAILPLKKIFKEKNIMYADDGIILTKRGREEKLFNKEELKNANITIHPEKSGWVRKKGVFKKPLKFLGMEWDGKKFRAKTRKGSTVEFDNEKQAMIWMSENKHLVDNGYTDTKKGLEQTINDLFTEYQKDVRPWDWYFKSKFIGYIFSKMQAGEWNKKIKQDFSLNFSLNSWTSLRCASFLGRYKIRERVNIFNISSFASKSVMDDMERDCKCYTPKSMRIKEYAETHKKLVTALLAKGISWR